MIYQKLFNLQKEFKAAKTQKNQFGNFMYRNFEQMMDTLKPLLDKYKCIILVDHNAQETSSGVYINTKVTLVDIEDSSTVSATSTVMDGDRRDRKELCNAQISGGSMSYGSKYALGYLLGVGTESDPDAYEPQKRNVKKTPTMTLIQQTTDKQSLMALWESLNDEEKGIFKPQFAQQKKKLGIK